MQLLKIKMFDVEKAIFCLLRLRLRFAAIVKKAKKKNRPFTVSRDGTSTYIEDPARFRVPLIKKPCMMSTTEYDNYYYFFFLKSKIIDLKLQGFSGKEIISCKAKQGCFDFDTNVHIHVYKR